MEPQYLPEALEGERIILKRHTMDQVEEHHQAILDNQDFLKRFMVWANPGQTLSDRKTFLARQVLAWEKKECFDYLIREKKTNKLLGGIGTVMLEWKHKKCEIGYWLTQDSEGKGYMSESLKLLEDELFKIGMNRIQIGAREINKRSQSVPKRNGYTYEGISREDVIENGETRSTVMHSKLRSDWEAE